MSRPITKKELIEMATENYDKLIRMIDEMTFRELSTPFDFSKDIGKKEDHWRRDKNLRDVIIHLYEWHQLLLTWVNRNMSDRSVTFIPEPYTWRTYGEMNMEFWRKHQETPLDLAMELFTRSHAEVMDLMRAIPEEVLFRKNVYPWVGSSTLGSYFSSVTSGHYEWAMKVLKEHKRNVSMSR